MADNQDISDLLDEIYALALKLPDSPAAFAVLPASTRRRLRLNLEATLHKLETVGSCLDPVSLPGTIFDPTAFKVVSKLVANTLLAQPREPLSKFSDARFYGAGVYSLYYNGPFDAYRPISGKDHPIYVGKADPVMPHAAGPREQGERLSARLRDHCRSIRGTTNLDLADFDCRYLVVKSACVETAEDHLIEHFKPVWNKEMKVCQGFGKHGDAPDTRANKRSPWDTLHPGRQWATRMGNVPGASTVKQIKAAIRKHFETYPPVG
ncbi:MAG: Eco29kI family restriction endonuclease [Verrucomicrobiia bacterium]